MKYLALEGVTVWELNSAHALLSIGERVLTGEIEAARGNADAAVAALSEGVEMETALTYDEPPPWHLPVRHVLGAVLLDVGRTGEAEVVYRDECWLRVYDGHTGKVRFAAQVTSGTILELPVVVECGRSFRLMLDNGMQVVVRGRVSLYEPRGDFQLIIEHLELIGLHPCKCKQRHNIQHQQNGNDDF